MATDAIGMGLNMDIEQISFSNLKKNLTEKKNKKIKNSRDFTNSWKSRRRYKNDGSFGVTGGCENLEVDEIEKIENHKLDDVKFLFWRNSDLNFKSPEELIQFSRKKNHQVEIFQKFQTL